jgi:hypothetical protein
MHYYGDAAPGAAAAGGDEDNHSEAGPDIATGITPSDLQAASQCESLLDLIMFYILKLV